MPPAHLEIANDWLHIRVPPVTGATVGPPVNGGQRWPTTVNGGGPPWTTAGPPPDHRSTTSQRWLTASQRLGRVGSTVATWQHVAADVAADVAEGI
ncbi:hypothetical protein Tco_0846175 [Tanacetum coccineum]